MRTRPWLAAIPVFLALVCLIFTVAPASAKRKIVIDDPEVYHGKVRDGMVIFRTVHPPVEDSVGLELDKSFIPAVIDSTEKLSQQPATGER